MTSQKFKIIEDYLNDELSVIEREKIKNLLQKDEELRQELTFHKDLDRLLRTDKSEEGLKVTLRNIHKKNSEIA